MAGADVVLVESPETAAEMRAVCRAILAPCPANMVEGGGRTPLLPQRNLAEIGYRIVINPNALEETQAMFAPPQVIESRVFARVPLPSSWRGRPSTGPATSTSWTSPTDGFPASHRRVVSR
jgi:hypothetical protein